MQVYHLGKHAHYKFDLKIQNIVILHVLVQDLCMFLSVLQSHRMHYNFPMNSNHHSHHSLKIILCLIYQRENFLHLTKIKNKMSNVFDNSWEPKSPKSQSPKMTVCHAITLSNAFVDPWYMLNNFCFHV